MVCTRLRLLSMRPKKPLDEFLGPEQLNFALHSLEFMPWEILGFLAKKSNRNQFVLVRTDC